VVSGWTEPIHGSRRGAAHRRRQQPCQDATAVGQVFSLDGLPVWVMAVADGHGGSRYRLSDRGSRLACERALAEVTAAVAQRRLGSPDDDALQAQWADWLARELPAAITSTWLEAITADWTGSAPPDGSDLAIDSDPAIRGESRGEPDLPRETGPSGEAAVMGESDGPRFAPWLYGTTLGLVLMTPHWWGQTGLGDWDLVRIDGNGQVSLVSEERQPIGAGEATCSLCQSEAAQLFAARSGLWPITAREAPFALLLGTDGLRKSCASDADFLVLASWLAGMPSGVDAPRGPQLAASLDRISREGSGDDISVTIGRLAAPADRPAPGLAPATIEPVLVAPAAVVPESALAKDSAGMAAGAGAAPSPPKPRAVAVLGLALLLAGVGVGATALLLPWPRMDGRTQGPSAELQALAQTARQLCSEPETISRQLNRRRALIDQIQHQPPKSGWLQREARPDPLAVWIALGLDQALTPERRRQRLALLGACPVLVTALTAAPGPAAAQQKAPLKGAR
jgi:hypothetical protein